MASSIFKVYLASIWDPNNNDINVLNFWVRKESR